MIVDVQDDGVERVRERVGLLVMLCGQLTTLKVQQCYVTREVEQSLCLELNFLVEQLHNCNRSLP